MRAFFNASQIDKKANNAILEQEKLTCEGSRVLCILSLMLRSVLIMTIMIFCWMWRTALQQLEQELPRLEAEKGEIEALMSSGTLSPDELMAKGRRMQELMDLIDEKELRWLELAEKVTN